MIESAMKLLIFYAIAWLGLVVLAILNGLIREKTYGRVMAELSAHQLSTLTGLLFFGVYTWILTGVYRIQSATQALIIGAMWVIMTILFEFVFGHYVIGHSWQRLLHDYNLRQGRVWLLVLVWTALAPYLFFRMHS